MYVHVPTPLISLSILILISIEIKIKIKINVEIEIGIGIEPWLRKSEHYLKNGTRIAGTERTDQTVLPVDITSNFSYEEE
jgi:hypothetical protein